MAKRDVCKVYRVTARPRDPNHDKDLTCDLAFYFNKETALGFAKLIQNKIDPEYKVTVEPVEICQ